MRTRLRKGIPFAVYLRTHNPRQETARLDEAGYRWLNDAP